MKKIIYAISALLLGAMASFAQSTATDFTANDCGGVSHNLFSELNAGKVLVIAWVMPCGSCIADPLSAHTVVETYQSSHPNTVYFYLADDFANTSCASLSAWAANYGMSNSTKFSNAAVDMSDYGTYGMPKIVVLGGADHKVYFNQNSSASGIGNAIDQAIAANAGVGFSEHHVNNFSLNAYPNPAINFINVTYLLNVSSDINLEVFNSSAQRLIFIAGEHQEAGEHQASIDLSQLDNGIYLLKLTTENGVEILKFTVSH